MRCATLILAFLLALSALAEEERPSHKPMRVDVGAGYADGLGSYVSAGYRFGLHDLLDPSEGFPESTSLELGVIRLRLPLQNTRFWLEELTVARVTSLPPMETITSERSWEIELGARTERERLCDRCVSGHLRAGLGFTVQPFSAPCQIFLLADVDVSYGPAYTGFPVKPGLGPHGGVRLRLSPTFSALIEGRYLYKLAADSPHVFDYGVTARWTPFERLALQAGWRRFVDTWESSAGLLAYF